MTEADQMIVHEICHNSLFKFPPAVSHLSIIEQTLEFSPLEYVYIYFCSKALSPVS